MGFTSDWWFLERLSALDCGKIGVAMGVNVTLTSAVWFEAVRSWRIQGPRFVCATCDSNYGQQEEK